MKPKIENYWDNWDQSRKQGVKEERKEEQKEEQTTRKSYKDVKIGEGKLIFFAGDLINSFNELAIRTTQTIVE